MNEYQVRALIRESIDKAFREFSMLHHESSMFMNPIKEFANQQQYNVPKIPDHAHNGTDSQQLDPASALKGFPVVATVPTDPAVNGTMRFYWDGVNYYLYARINNTWKRFKSA